MFSAKVLRNLQMLIKDARDNDVPVVFTRWCRTDTMRGDAVDQKEHWSAYIPKEQSEILSELTVEEEDAVCSVIHSNALTHTSLMGIAEESARLVIAGGWTESCVSHTAHAASEIGHLSPCAVVSDATVGHALVHTLCLVHLQLICADVVRAFL